MENSGLVSEEAGAIVNNTASYRVEIFHLVGTEALKELSEALDEAILLLAGIVV
jgi:hypothetical protein